MYLILLTIYTEDNRCVSAPVCLGLLPLFIKCSFCLEWLRHSVALTEDQTLLRQPYSSSLCITNYLPCPTNSQMSTGIHWDQTAHSYANSSTTSLSLSHNSKWPTMTYRPE